MGRRWKWFARPGKVVLDLTGQAVPDGDVPGRFRRLVVEHVVPELRVTSRCDGAIVYERPEERVEAAPPDDLPLTAAELQRANRVAERHWCSPSEDPRSRRCPDCRGDGTCPQAAWADAILARCLRTYWR